MINVLGDALAAGIMAHICKKDFDKAAAATAATAAANNGRVRFVSQHLFMVQTGDRWELCKYLKHHLWQNIL